MLNVPDIQEGLQLAFPATTVVALPLRNLSAVEQLQYLETVSVMITTAGSASFRLIFLPTGAQVWTRGRGVGRWARRRVLAGCKLRWCPPHMTVPAHKLTRPPLLRDRRQRAAAERSARR